MATKIEGANRRNASMGDALQRIKELTSQIPYILYYEQPEGDQAY